MLNRKYESVRYNNKQPQNQKNQAQTQKATIITKPKKDAYHTVNPIDSLDHNHTKSKYVISNNQYFESSNDSDNDTVDDHEEDDTSTIIGIQPHDPKFANGNIYLLTLGKNYYNLENFVGPHEIKKSLQIKSQETVIVHTKETIFIDNPDIYCRFIPYQDAMLRGLQISTSLNNITDKVTVMLYNCTKNVVTVDYEEPLIYCIFEKINRNIVYENSLIKNKWKPENMISEKVKSKIGEEKIDGYIGF